MEAGPAGDLKAKPALGSASTTRSAHQEELTVGNAGCRLGIHHLLQAQQDALMSCPFKLNFSGANKADPVNQRLATSPEDAPRAQLLLGAQVHQLHAGWQTSRQLTNQVGAGNPPGRHAAREAGDHQQFAIFPARKRCPAATAARPYGKTL